MAKRPPQQPVRRPLTDDEIGEACYIGSPEHKAERWWGGLPEAYVGADGRATRPKKQDTTICPLTKENERLLATGWVRDALSRGQQRFHESDKVFPRHIWYKESSGQYWFGRCINTVLGQYKGWPVDEEEKRGYFD